MKMNEIKKKKGSKQKKINKKRATFEKINK